MSFGDELVAQLLENWRGKAMKLGATAKDEVAVPPGRDADANVTGSAYPGSMRRGRQPSLPVGAASR
jgi:hypothetical protein